MADNDILVDSVEAALRSELGMSSARMMKSAFLHYTEKESDEKSRLTLLQPENIPFDDGVSGPEAMVSITKISTRTPDDEIKKLLKSDPGREKILRNYDFYTIVLIASIQMADSSTTRFINATLEFVFPHDVKILDYSPKERGSITGIFRSGGTGISISRDLDFTASSSQTPLSDPCYPGHRFEVIAGHAGKITGNYSIRSGFSLDVSSGELLEYQIMPKNEHALFCELYPPMPQEDFETTGKENLAIFSIIIQTPHNFLPEMSILIKGKVKGDLWGVVPLEGSVVFIKKEAVNLKTR